VAQIKDEMKIYADLSDEEILQIARTQKHISDCEGTLRERVHHVALAFGIQTGWVGRLQPHPHCPARSSRTNAQPTDPGRSHPARRSGLEGSQASTRTRRNSGRSSRSSGAWCRSPSATNHPPS
jgi:hypothetical protein